LLDKRIDAVLSFQSQVRRLFESDASRRIRAITEDEKVVHKLTKKYREIAKIKKIRNEAKLSNIINNITLERTQSNPF